MRSHRYIVTDTVASHLNGDNKWDEMLRRLAPCRSLSLPGFRIAPPDRQHVLEPVGAHRRTPAASASCPPSSARFTAPALGNPRVNHPAPTVRRPTLCPQAPQLTQALVGVDVPGPRLGGGAPICSNSGPRAWRLFFLTRCRRHGGAAPCGGGWGISE
jgi:hypothetical protein